VRLLLDTHALLWWFAGDSRLSPRSRDAIGNSDNEVLVSAASAWEIATKHRLGKLPEAGALVVDLQGAITSQAFGELPVCAAEAIRAGALSGPLRDPFDRMLIAQALTRDLVLVSNEAVFDHYGARRLW